MSEVTFIPLIKAQSRSIALPVKDNGPSQEDHIQRRARLGFGKPEPKVIKREIVEQHIFRPDPPKKERDFLAIEPTPVNIKAVHWRQVILQCLTKHKIHWDELYSLSRVPRVAACRKEIAFRLRRELEMNYQSIAKRLGLIDHSSAIHLERAYALAHGFEVMSTIRADADEARRIRDERILALVKGGKRPAEVAEIVGLTRNTVGVILTKMGYSQRQALHTRLREGKKQRDAVKMAEVQARNDARAQAKREVYFLTLRMAETYKSAFSAWKCTGVNRQTIITRMRRYNLKFTGEK